VQRVVSTSTIWRRSKQDSFEFHKKKKKKKRRRRRRRKKLLLVLLLKLV
jgi:hypothetical protein